jgi:hypothetical protein
LGAPETKTKSKATTENVRTGIGNNRDKMESGSGGHHWRRLPCVDAAEVGSEFRPGSGGGGVEEQKRLVGGVNPATGFYRPALFTR